MGLATSCSKTPKKVFIGPSHSQSSFSSNIYVMVYNAKRCSHNIMEHFSTTNHMYSSLNACTFAIMPILKIIYFVNNPTSLSAKKSPSVLDDKVESL
jgi:hypothetical protein